MLKMIEPAASGDLDIQIGQWIRALRIAKGWSQEDLAKRVGLSFQQIQKYESGNSRILASKLHEFASVFGIDVGYFYHGMPETLGEGGKLDATVVFEKDAWKAASQFNRIKNKETRKKILELITSLAQD